MPKILIFDPDTDFANTLASRMESIGVEPVLMETQSTAAARMAWDDFDMVCVDVDVETGLGLAFCEYLEWNLDTQNVPVVILTSRSHPDQIRRHIEFFPDYVRKSTNCWNELESIMFQRWPHLRPIAVS